MSGSIEVEVVYALHDVQKVMVVRLGEGATLEQAVAKSGLLEEYPEIDLGGRNKVGVWNKLSKLDTVLRDKDRVEIYRPLIADPKEVRRQRAAEGKVMKKGAAELNAGEGEAAG
ncbi:MAG: RnfH family protein [Hydrogenophilaceae bacterium]|nr:RnfH family protein [Hydrogenophilaceae bacterium]